jgi:hypothetical protein
MSDEQVRRALQMLAAADRDLAAPPAVEERLKLAFRRQRKILVWKRTAIWTMAAAAAIVGIAVLRDAKPKQPAAPIVSQVQPPATGKPAVKPPEVQQVVVSSSPKRPRAPRVQPVQREVVTEFFPLVDYAPPFERGELVRMRVPASTMRAVGLPVREDRLSDPVQAEVLVGQEGMARAIRFVGYSQSSRTGSVLERGE